VSHHRARHTVRRSLFLQYGLDVGHEMAAFLQDEEQPLLCIATNQVKDHIDLLSWRTCDRRSGERSARVPAQSTPAFETASRGKALANDQEAEFAGKTLVEANLAWWSDRGGLSSREHAPLGSSPIRGNDGLLFA